MSSWRVEFSDDAKRDFLKLDLSVRSQVIERLSWLADNFENITPLPLHHELKGFFKIRVGNWRVAYAFDSTKSEIKVHMIKNRNKAYKRRR